MGANSAIEWTDHTFNPWVGCTRVSPGCDHCYAEAWARRTGQPALWTGERRRTTAANWHKPKAWNDSSSRMNAPRAPEARVFPRVFCASLADVCDNQVPTEWRADLIRLISNTPWLNWLLLTKRPQLAAQMFPDAMWSGWRHVWFGATVESQEEGRRRIRHLQAVPAAVRFLSCEPLLEPIEPELSGIGWVICGGESGPNARPMHPSWARALRDQCAAAGVPFFMKQMAKKAPIPDDLMVRQFPDA